MHHPLKHLAYIAQTEWHTEEIKKAKSDGDGNFANVLWGDDDSMVAMNEVYL